MAAQSGHRLTWNEDRYGSLEVGKVADMVVLAEDPLSCDLDRGRPRRSNLPWRATGVRRRARWNDQKAPIRGVERRRVGAVSHLAPLVPKSDVASRRQHGAGARLLVIKRARRGGRGERRVIRQNETPPACGTQGRLSPGGVSGTLKTDGLLRGSTWQTYEPLKYSSRNIRNDRTYGARVPAPARTGRPALRLRGCDQYGGRFGGLRRMQASQPRRRRPSGDRTWVAARGTPTASASADDIVQ